MRHHLARKKVPSVSASGETVRHVAHGVHVACSTRPRGMQHAPTWHCAWPSQAESATVGRCVGPLPLHCVGLAVRAAVRKRTYRFTSASAESALILLARRRHRQRTTASSVPHAAAAAAALAQRPGGVSVVPRAVREAWLG